MKSSRVYLHVVSGGQRPRTQMLYVILGSLWDILRQCPRKGMVIPVFEDENSWCLSCLKSFLKHRGCKTNRIVFPVLCVGSWKG